MTRFLIFYFVAYGGAHVYLFVKLKRAFSLSPKKQLVLAPGLATLFVAPLIARKLDSINLDKFAELFSGGGYLWMGGLFLFFTAAASIDILNLCCSKTSFKISARNLFLISATYAITIGTYGYYEARNIVPEHLTIMSDRIPITAGKLRIVQISDVHIGQIVRDDRIKEIISIITAASPDILVSTGDLVDGHQKHFNGLERFFLDLRPRLGKYAILGNHEYYVGVEESEKFMRDAGFKVLKNESFELGGLITIIGVDDSRNRATQELNTVIEQRLLESAVKSEFKLFLKHRPVIEKGSVGKFDLQLSGHVHKGQIFPFNVLTWLSYPVSSGHTLLKQESHLYVSRGTGVWGPPIRFLAPPEITIIDLLPATNTTRKN